MWKHPIIFGALVVAASGAAWAAAPASTQQCHSLQSEFRSAEQSRPPSTQRREARYFANEGKSWCETEHAGRGSADYQHALQILKTGQAGPAPS
ncbi:MAG: hypothetical protein GC190_07210 [Alphaproteobacteria bacterium]|nr:hypothetical protein [Alphaproteobacteria bacterium]